jgi:hypothetical protein
MNGRFNISSPKTGVIADLWGSRLMGNFTHCGVAESQPMRFDFVWTGLKPLVVSCCNLNMRSIRMNAQLLHAFIAFGLQTFTLVFANSAYAVPMDVNFTLTADTVDQAPLPQCAGGPEFGPTFGCSNAIGDTYVGSFRVDDSILTGDGLLTGVPVSDFFLQIGDVIWSQNPVPNNSFAGFRGLATEAPGPGLVVSGGALVDLAGGVFGIGDHPFVDFSSPGFLASNRFSALDDPDGTRLQGCLTTGNGSACPVPEPGTSLLFLVGALGLALTLTNRSKR